MLGEPLVHLVRLRPALASLTCAAATVATLTLASCSGDDQGSTAGTTAASTTSASGGSTTASPTTGTTTTSAGSMTDAGTTASATTSADATSSTGADTTGGTTSPTTDDATTVETDGETSGTTTGGDDILPSAGCGLDAESGHFPGLTTLVDGVERSYDLFIPTPYEPEKPHAVIFSYHGAGGMANTDQFHLDENSEANDGFSINVAPQGWPSQEWDKNHFVPFNLEVSVKVFDQVLDTLAEERCVDLNRVFVIGHSNGGQMAFHLGCLRGDRVRAIFPSGGRCFSYGQGVCDPYNPPNAQQCSGAVKVMSVMGQEDVTRHADEEATLAGFRARQGCSAATEPSAPSPCLEFQGCDPGEEVASCRIPELAHALWKPGFDPLYDVMMSL